MPPGIGRFLKERIHIFPGAAVFVVKVSGGLFAVGENHLSRQFSRAIPSLPFAIRCAVAVDAGGEHPGVLVIVGVVARGFAFSEMNAAGYSPGSRIIHPVALCDCAGIIGEHTGRTYFTRSIVIDLAPAAVGLCRDGVDPGPGIVVADGAIPGSVLGVGGQEEEAR